MCVTLALPSVLDPLLPAVLRRIVATEWSPSMLGCGSVLGLHLQILRCEVVADAVERQCPDGGAKSSLKRASSTES